MKNQCNKLSFEECELSILRIAIDNAEKKIGRRVVNSEEIKKIINIVEVFIKKKNLICYGGTAINNILPIEEQFYNKEIEIPDYDFFSGNALDDVKELADIYYNNDFTDVEAKSGQHHGTYKVFVNYIPIADITLLDKQILNALKKDAIRVGGILYAPPNFLRMSMYLELSRPDGDTSRWEKVLKRLILLNKNYPITELNCVNIDFQREMSLISRKKENSKYEIKENDIYNNIRNTFINQGVVFFGSYAISLYSKYMPNSTRKKVQEIADFDVLSNNPKDTSDIVKERLKDINIKNVKIVKHNKIGEIIPECYEIIVNTDTIAFIYKPIACHSYNVYMLNGQKIKIATIDTMLSFYLAFLYANKPYYNEFLERILCMTQFLYKVQQENRLSQKGLLKRFSTTCYGHQETIEEIRANKAIKYKELKGKPNFDEWFLNYKPEELNKSKNLSNKLKTKKHFFSKNNLKKRKTKKNKNFLYKLL